jgi:hypothetical protein
VGAMKWMLVAIVMQTPIKTDLVFDSLKDCLVAEGQMRSTWAVTGNIAADDNRKNSRMTDNDRKEYQQYFLKQTTWGTCIPAK